MAFIPVDKRYCDTVSFYIRPDFSDNPGIVYEYITRGDELSLRYYIKEYMDTKVSIRRPNTPAKLIIQSIPHDYQPIY